MSKHSTEDVDRLARMFKALSNPNRLRIFLRLMSTGCGVVDRRVAAEAGGCCVGDAGGDLGIALSTVSHHIKELRQSGLVVVTRRGKTVTCRLGDEALQCLEQFVRRPREAVKTRR